ncbi:serine/threonine-protein kinase [Haloferula sp.]|uniref:serine/threonine-protein kinase n=1 Tax=Haloferula sp. TaxID=2497595 RepID=UPI003C74BF9B
MNDDTPDPKPPRLRGLEVAKLIGVLEKPSEPSPEIPGWELLGIAGHGGFGTVWKAARGRDGALAAIKLARPDDPETLDRIESEASVLAALDHPGIVRLLDSGPIDDLEGGVFLAMEFIDGSPLSELIPADGMEPQKAYESFLHIARAVAHAHDAGILHRDLKPGNILVDESGGVHVADFGLALPVHRRVQQLSLTRAGMVAGTAEYLPPEAYHRGYRPTVAADVFALGVILHEMLIGAPPRGAWPAVSSIRHIDVRIDGIIRRALDPDPSNRWQDVSSMAQALEQILASPPRFDGTPLVSRAVRAADGLWSILGCLALAAALYGIDHYNQSVGSPHREFLGIPGRLLGAFMALLVSLALLLPMNLWQLMRLWRFRGVPLRESLPSPFGLQLGFSRTTTLLVSLTQLFLFLIPVFCCFILWLDSCDVWLKPSDPPSVHGLAITAWDNQLQIASPWRLPETGKRFWLIDSFGPPQHPFSQTAGRVEFFPFVTPLLMFVSGSLAVLTIAVTFVTALLSWWRRRKRISAIASVILAGAALVFLSTIFANEQRRTLESLENDMDRPYNRNRYTAAVTEFAADLISSNGKLGEPTLQNASRFYADSVDYHSRGLIPRDEVLEVLGKTIPAMEEIVATHRHRSWSDWNPDDGSLRTVAEAIQYSSSPETEGADFVRIEFDGFLQVSGEVSIQKERVFRQPLFRADPLQAGPAVAESWAAAFREAVHAGWKPSDDRWDTLFHPGQLQLGENDSLPISERGRTLLEEKLGILIENPPSFLDEEVKIRDSLPGGIIPIAIPVFTSQALSRRWWVADLIHSDGTWRAVNLSVESR